jgi:hypothetical protein
MSESTAVVLFVGGIVLATATLIAAIVIIAKKAARQRLEGLRRAAGHMRLEFTERGPDTIVAELGQYHLFSQGRGRKIRNLCSGRPADIFTRIFDYQYTVGSGQHSSTYRQTVALFEAPDLRLPAFQARPEHFFHRVAEKFGKQDIDFEQDEEFSKEYVLRGDDEAAIRRLFNNPVRSHLTGMKKTSVEGRGNQLIVYRLGKRVEPQDLDEFLKSSVHMLAMFKTAAAP